MKNSNEISQTLWEKIEKYLLHRMSADEIRNFEKEIDENPNLKSQIQEVQAFNQNIQKAILREKLEEFHQELPQSDNKTRKLTLRKTMFWAAACVVLIIAGFLWLNPRNSSEKIFEKHYTHDPGLPTTMSNSENYAFFDGMLDFKQKEFNIALGKWAPLLTDNPNNDTLNYFVGLSYLALGNSDKAEDFIVQVAQMDQSIFYEDANFYFALTLLKNGEKDRAIEILSHQNSERSQNLLEDLNR